MYTPIVHHARAEIAGRELEARTAAPGSPMGSLVLVTRDPIETIAIRFGGTRIPLEELLVDDPRESFDRPDDHVVDPVPLQRRRGVGAGRVDAPNIRLARAAVQPVGPHVPRVPHERA